MQSGCVFCPHSASASSYRTSSIPHSCLRKHNATQLEALPGIPEIHLVDHQGWGSTCTSHRKIRLHPNTWISRKKPVTLTMCVTSMPFHIFIHTDHITSVYITPEQVKPPTFPRVNSGIRVQSKEQMQPMTQKRPQPTNQKPTTTKQKTGFTISSPAEDEDEWISSEAGSGAATPDDSSDDDEDSRDRSRTPVDESETTPGAQRDGVFTAATPRAQTSMPRVASARLIAPLEQVARQPVKRVPNPAIVQPTEQSSHRRQHTEPNVMESRSGTTSPTHHSHRHDSSKRNSTTRPPSVHSIRTEVPLRPHPLIRGQSYGQSSIVGPTSKPTPLAPLTVISGSSTAQLSSSPPNISTSPASIRTAYGPQSSPNRRTSISSQRSVATLPVSPQQPSKANHDRHRTLSTMSSSSTSSFAALTSLAHLPAAASRPSTPQYTSYFPVQNPHVNLDVIHPLLPPPYLGTHLTVLATRSPIKESFERVVWAKQSR